jgi:hypothetical protein
MPQLGWASLKSNSLRRSHIVDLQRNLTHFAAEFANESDPRLRHNPAHDIERGIGVIVVALLGVIRRRAGAASEHGLC